MHTRWPWNRRSASPGCVSSTPLSASPNAHPPGPETWVPAARDKHAESVVIPLLTVAAMAGTVLTLRQMRRNRQVNELLLRLRMRDALLTDESLAALPIALTVHLPCAFWSPAVVEITGRVPTAHFRDDVCGSRSGSCRGGAQELRPPRGSWSNR